MLLAQGVCMASGAPWMLCSSLQHAFCAAWSQLTVFCVALCATTQHPCNCALQCCCKVSHCSA